MVSSFIRPACKRVPQVLFVGGVFFLLILTGCASPTTEPTVTQQAAVTEVPTSALTSTTARQTEDTPEPTTQEGALTLEHTRGELTLPEPTTRVVALEWTYIEDLLAVGVQPVGAADIDGYQKWVNIEPALSSDVTDVGTRQEPSLEAITALEPDLIIGVKFRHEPIYDDLSEIAPTLLFSPYPPDDGPNQYQEMRETFLTISEAVGKQEEGREVLTDMEATFDQARSQLAGSGYEGSDFALAQAFTSQETPTIRLFSQNAMASIVLEQLGLNNAWDVVYETYGFSTVDVEALAEVEEANFFYVVQENDNVFEEQLADNPVWQNLDFVKNDRTHALGGNTWLFGGPLSNELVAEKIVELLTGE